MKVASVFGLMLAVALFAGAAPKGSLTSGPQVGEDVGAFEVVKVAGAQDDGVEEGKELCYRCKLGNRPVVMVFTHKTDKMVTKLVKELDKVVAKNKSHKMGSFVNLLGDDVDSLKEHGKQLAADAELANVAIVVPADHKTGPENYNIDPHAEVTVLIYEGGKVKANHAFGEGELNEAAVKQVVADTSKILQ